MSPERTLEQVLAAQAAEPGAQDALIDAWLPQVLAWCRRTGGPTVDHEDAAHDVMIVVITRLDALRKPERFESWLYGITRKTLAGHRRRAWVRRWLPGMVPDTADPSANPRRDSELSQLSRSVQRVLDKIPDAQREVLVLHDVEERSDSEVAELLGISRNTVKSRLRLAREKFRHHARHEDFRRTHLEVISGGRS